jgi:hypothetical protein
VSSLKVCLHFIPISSHITLQTNSAVQYSHTVRTIDFQSQKPYSIMSPSTQTNGATSIPPIKKPSYQSPKPRFFIVRPDGSGGAIVPLIPYDELPKSITLAGTSRSLELQDTIGMVILGISRMSGGMYTLTWEIEKAMEDTSGKKGLENWAQDVDEIMDGEKYISSPSITNKLRICN